MLSKIDTEFSLTTKTWPEVQSYLARSKGIIIPVGSTEQHGPNGPLGTDSLCAELVAFGIAKIVGGIVGPTINLGMAQHHLKFPGSISLRPSTLMSVLQDYVLSLATQGFQRFFFVNGHGGNVATVKAAFDEIYSMRSFQIASSPSEISCALVNWWDPEPVARFCEREFGEDDGIHATPSEFSLVSLIDESYFRPIKVSEKASPTQDFTDSANFRTRFPDGRVGSDPNLRSKALGEKIFSLSTEELSKKYRSFCGMVEHQ